MSYFKQDVNVGQPAPETRSQDTPWQSRSAMPLMESLGATLAKQQRADNETVARLQGFLEPHWGSANSWQKNV